MSILSSIFDRLLHHARAQDTTTASAPASTAPSTSAAGSGAAPQPTTAAQAGAPGNLSDVDVEKVLEGLAAKNPQKLNWRTSIVDLMKLLGLDSSLQQRQALAEELHYTGDRNDSAAMNIWLHEQVMQKLAANGGKVPADLMH